MTIKNGLTQDADDIAQNVRAYLKNQIQLVRMEASISLTDADWTYSIADTISDADGELDTIDDGTSTAVYNGELGGYILGSTSNTLYDTFGDDTIDTNLWTVTGDVGGSVVEAGGAATVTATNPGSEELTSDTAFPGYVKFTISSTSGKTAVWIGGTGGDAIFNVESGNQAGTWDVRQTSATNWKIYKDDVFVSNLTSPSGFIQFRGRDDGVLVIADVYMGDGLDPTLNKVYTVSKTMAGNISSVFVTAGETLPGTTSAATVDVSTDGGSNWDATDQAIDTVIACDGDDTDLVIILNLQGTASVTPILHNYAVQVWT